jgi:hypothetical protein
MRGYGAGSMAVPVYSFVGGRGLSGACACRNKLGDASSDLNFGVPTDLVDFTAPPPVNYPASPESGLTYAPTPNVPAGYGYGPSPDGGVAIYPAGAATPDVFVPKGLTNPQASQLPGSGVISVFNNPASSPLSMQGQSLPTTAASASSFLGGISSTTLLLGGLGLLAAIMIAKRR